MIVEFFLDSGSNFSSGTAPTAWEAQTNADRNANNFAIGSSTDNDFAITGVQLEVGEFTSATIPPFQHEMFGNNIVRCKRYYQQLDRPSYGDNTMLTGISSAGNEMFMMRLPVSMRSAPTISMTGTNITLYSTSGSSNTSSVNPTLSAGTFGTDGGRLLYARIGDVGAGCWIDIDNNNTSMNFDAEI